MSSTRTAEPRAATGTAPAGRRRRRPHRLSPVRAALRESLRDRVLLAQAVVTPVLVVVAAVVLGQLGSSGDPQVVQVAGARSAVAVERSLTAAGEEVRTAGGGTARVTALGAPGPGVDATVTVPEVGAVLVRVAPSATWAVGDLLAAVQRALPGRTVRVLGPDGHAAHGVSGQLQPAVLVLTAVVLALPGTAGRVRAWRRRGTLALLAGTTTARGVRAVRLAGALLASRLLLAVPAVVVVAAVNRPGPVPLLLLVLLAAAGTAAGTAVGALVGGLLRTGRETGPLLWAVAALVGLFGGVLLPAAVLPDAADTVLQFTPTAWFADGVRTALAGGPVLPALLPVAGLLAVAGAAWGALTGICARAGNCAGTVRNAPPER